MGKAENYVERYLRDRVKAHKGMCLKFASAINGVPDRVVILAGRTIFVEAKAKNGSLSELQKVRIPEMRAAGADVRVISTREGVDEFIRELTHGNPSGSPTTP